MHNRFWWFACLALSACTQIVDFDRSKIPGNGAPDGATPVDGNDGNMDAGRDGGPNGMDAGRDGGPDADPGPVCNVATHVGCGDNQLCCVVSGGASCVDTTPDQCTACNSEASPMQGACNVETAATCSNRRCECVPGSGMACSGDTPRCLVDVCVDCATDEDCPEDGLGQCVDGQCRACDSEDGGTGCANPTPICVANDCVACGTENTCRPPLTCDDGSCFGCVVGTNEGCSGVVPICKETEPGSGVFQCVPCANDGQCGGQQCVPQSGGAACQACDPRAGQGNAGCTSAAAPICAGTPAACIACNEVSRVNDDLNNAACTDESAGTVCISAGEHEGECGACNPADDDGCANTNDQCNLDTDTDTYTCVDCIGGAGCGNNQVCVTGGNTCVECNSNAECGDEQCNTATHRCEDCLNASHCSGAEGCVNFDCAPCMNDGQCTGSASGGQCVEVSGNRQCRACNPAGTAAIDPGCSAATPECSPTSFTCVECLSAADCAAGEGCLAGTCGECANDSQCAGRAGATQCTEVAPDDFECRACDPAGNGAIDAGCSAATPQCNASFTCVACLTAADCGAGQGCLASGACGECGNDGQCAGSATGTQCANHGGGAFECSACDPANDEGCSPGAAECSPTSFTCVQCLTAAQCTGTQGCIAGTCGVCANDGQCTGSTSGGECTNAAGGAFQCRECDPNGDAGCSGGTPQCNPATLECVECLTAAECPGSQGCVSNDCRTCTSDDDCSGSRAGLLCRVVLPNVFAQCSCDPGANEGCAMGQTCNASSECE